MTDGEKRRQLIFNKYSKNLTLAAGFINDCDKVAGLITKQTLKKFDTAKRSISGEQHEIKEVKKFRSRP